MRDSLVVKNVLLGPTPLKTEPIASPVKKDTSQVMQAAPDVTHVHQGILPIRQGRQNALLVQQDRLHNLQEVRIVKSAREERFLKLKVLLAVSRALQVWCLNSILVQQSASLVVRGSFSRKALRRK